MASIDSVTEKVIWCAEHLNALKIEILGYLNNGPCEVTAEAEPGTNRLISRVRTKVPIPSSIPLRIGDCFQNLRSSLDYLVWELVLAVNNTPTNKHQFPICDKAEALKTRSDEDD